MVVVQYCSIKKQTNVLVMEKMVKNVNCSIKILAKINKVPILSITE